MKLRIYRKRGGRSYNYRGSFPGDWVARDEDGNEYATAEEADAAIAAAQVALVKEKAVKPKVVKAKEVKEDKDDKG